MRFFDTLRRASFLALTGALPALLLGGRSANAEVVQKTPQGFVVREVIEVQASPEKVWTTLAIPAQWWNPEYSFSGSAENFSLDLTPGGCLCEKLPSSSRGSAARAGGVAHMRVAYVEPGRVLRMTGALGPLQSEAVSGVWTITLKSVGGKTRVLFEYIVGGFMRYTTDQIAPVVDKIVASQLSRLAVKIDPSSLRSDTVIKVPDVGVGKSSDGLDASKPDEERVPEVVAKSGAALSQRLSVSNEVGSAGVSVSKPEQEKVSVARIAADLDAVMGSPSSASPSKPVTPSISKSSGYVYREQLVHKSGAAFVLVQDGLDATPMRLVFSSPSIEASFRKRFVELSGSGKTVVCQCTGSVEQTGQALNFRAIEATLIAR